MAAVADPGTGCTKGMSGTSTGRLAAWACRACLFFSLAVVLSVIYVLAPMKMEDLQVALSMADCYQVSGLMENVFSDALRVSLKHFFLPTVGPLAMPQLSIECLLDSLSSGICNCIMMV